MSEVVHVLWFVKEMPEGKEDVELLIGVYSSEVEAKAAIERSSVSGASAVLQIFRTSSRSPRYH